MNSSVHTSNPKLTNTNGTTAPINMSEMNNYIIWQTEMEKGYQALVKAIHPYLKDLNEADALFDGVKSTSSMM